MAENSKIEWCNHTANLWWGCTKVHAGCDHCYAETLSNRWDFQVWGNDNPRRAINSVWKDLDRFQKIADGKNEIHKVFVGSMMDIFEKPMPLRKVKDQSYPEEFTTGTLRDVLFLRISENRFPNLLFLFLTKRPSNINKYIPPEWKTNPPANVMYGTSPCDQETFDKLVPQLYQVNAKRFLSIEPQIAEIDITKELPTGKGQAAYGLLMDWIICGGESGHGKRHFNPDWGRKIMNDCKTANVPFFIKQIDKVVPIPDDLMIRQFPNA